MSFGAPGPASGEVVFNTAMTGYQEIATDPSYQGQLVCFTAPHIGIVGVNQLDEEDRPPQALALIVRDLSRSNSSWRAQGGLDSYCAKHLITGIAEVDTRSLTMRLRDGGAVNGCVLRGEDEKQALEHARSVAPMMGSALGKQAGAAQRIDWSEAAWNPKSDEYLAASADGLSIAVLNCGAKRAIMRELASRGAKVTVVPYSTKATEITEKFDAVVISNGPGDPQPLEEARSFIAQLLERGVPLLGICLGHQILAEAAKAKIFKMKFGHHGANHPILDIASGVVSISSQNHGFAVATEDFPEDLEITHTSLFDGSIAGIRHKSKPAIGFQGHPEASPGPRELTSIFDNLIKMAKDARANS